MNAPAMVASTPPVAADNALPVVSSDQLNAVVAAVREQLRNDPSSGHAPLGFPPAAGFAP